MNTLVGVCLGIMLLSGTSLAASKPHLVVFGKWTTIKWAPDGEGDPLEVKIRPLYVDGKVKEFLFGAAHEVTERAFVAQRMFRLNDSLPQETGPIRWRWEKGGWVMVDRVTGKEQPLRLPEFDPYYSAVSGFRDYAAYCGVSDDGQKTFAVVVQLGRRKPLLKKTTGDATSGAMPCASPVWQRDPVRASFEAKGNKKITFLVKSRAVDLESEEESEGEE